MLYERKLRSEPKGWGMQMEESFDMFFYQEDEDEDDNDENLSRIYCLALEHNKEVESDDLIRLHAFSLPKETKDFL